MRRLCGRLRDQRADAPRNALAATAQPGEGLRQRVRKARGCGGPIRTPLAGRPSHVCAWIAASDLAPARGGMAEGRADTRSEAAGRRTASGREETRAPPPR